MGNKKKLIRIELAKELESIYHRNTIDNSGLNIAFIGKDDETKDGFRFKKQITQFVRCREILCIVPRLSRHPALIKLKGSTCGFNENSTKIDFDNLRLLLAYPDNSGDIKNRVFSAKRIVNILEEQAGWKEKSVITTVRHTQFTNNNNMFMLTCPKEWMMAPQMLSLVVLLIRIPLTVKKEYESNTYKELQQELNTLSKNADYRDTTFLSEIRKKIVKLMESVEKVFGSDLDKNWPFEDSNFMGYGGINTLFKCCTGRSNLDERFKSIVLKK